MQFIFDRTSAATKWGIDDVERILSNVVQIDEILTGELGFLPIAPTLSFEEGYVTIEKLNTVRDRVEEIRSRLPYGGIITPETLQNITVQAANDIEKVLYETTGIIDKLRASWYYSGEIYAGGAY